MQVRTFVELDIDIPSTGASFSSTSFDDDSFDPDAFNFGGEESTVANMFRFSQATEEVLFDSIPALESVSVTPAIVDPGVSIGVRATVNASIRDFQYPLDGTDYFTGTFFGKLRAIKPSLQGSGFRLIRGKDDETLEEMITEHYVVESMSRQGDLVKIVAKDILKLADGDRAQAPAISNGRLLEDIDDVVTTATLTPAGIGALEYPTSGKAALGDEIVSYTRAGDVLTITRGQSNTVATEHDADDIVQQVLIYDALSPADIVFDLITEYSAVDPDWCPLAEWQEDIDTYIGRLYSAEIAEPTPVNTLLNEIIVQAGLVMWWDEIAQQVKLKSLRPVTGTRVIHAEEMISDTFGFTEQPTKRRSQAWTYFALKNPLERLDETRNFLSGLVTVDPASDLVYGQTAICKNFCRWIAKNNRPAASRLNSLLLSRYTDPPRKFSFALPRDAEEPVKGQGVRIAHRSLQDASGAAVTVPIVITSVEKRDDRYRVDAEEMLFTEIVDEELPDGVKLIIIDTNVVNFNLRLTYDTLYTSVSSGDSILCTIEEGVFVGSNAVSKDAFVVGSWPAGVDIHITNNGRIQGKGGNGASGFIGSGQPGGGAFLTRYPCTVENNGEIDGGGGGGGGSGAGFGAVYGGGGGAGFKAGQGGIGAQSGTPNAGGQGSPPLGGAGGGRGQDGEAGVGPGGTAGGNAGLAVDGDSFVTWEELGTIRGNRVN